MRPLPLILASGVFFAPRSARAAEPDTGLAFASAAAFDAAGFIVGGALLGSSASGASGDGQRSLGWLAVQAGFTLSPLAAHGVVGEWDRGVAFAAIPAGTLSGTAAYLRTKTDGVEHNTLGESRVLWGLFSTGLAVSTAGAIDVLFAASRQRDRTITVWPTLGAGQVGLCIQGTL
jgi:hypothetical protein